MRRGERERLRGRVIVRVPDGRIFLLNKSGNITEFFKGLGKKGRDFPTCITAHVLYFI